METNYSNCNNVEYIDIKNGDDLENDEDMENEDDFENVEDMENKDSYEDTHMECDVSKEKHNNMGLPRWVFESINISQDLLNLHTKFEDLKLNKLIQDNLTKNNMKYCYPVQEHVIPWLLRHDQHFRHFELPARDICISVPTGSGKTLSFVIPIIQTLIGRVVPRLRALIITPTNELVRQVYGEFNKYAMGSDLKIKHVISHLDFENDTINLVRKRKVCGEEYESRIDVLITTPSFLMTILQNVEGFSLKYLQFMVFDEADYMITSQNNYWFSYLQNQVQAVVNGISINNKEAQFKKPQKIFLSATLNHNLMFLEKANLFKPQLFSCGNTGKICTNPNHLQQFFLVVETPLKLLAICDILNQGYQNVLIFVNTRDGVHNLNNTLQLSNMNLVIEGLAADTTLAERLKILQGFASGDINVLITTDLLAHGIDFDVDCVISMDFPVSIINYAHRVGRTARCGKSGTAITLVNSKNVEAFTTQLKTFNGTEIKQIIFDHRKHMDKFNQLKNSLEKINDKTRIKKK